MPVVVPCCCLSLTALRSLLSASSWLSRLWQRSLLQKALPTVVETIATTVSDDGGFGLKGLDWQTSAVMRLLLRNQFMDTTVQFASM